VACSRHEAQHYVRFVELARRVAGGALDVDARLVAVREVEDGIARELGHRPTLHG
jgi:tRNA isopentenyl-2-thiomethyl-A-37 hydroxylase MiaE